jgi:hypothetical protein
MPRKFKVMKLAMKRKEKMTWFRVFLTVRTEKVYEGLEGKKGE